MTLLEAAAMFAASILGGAVNSIAGGGTLITFPVLLSLGLDPRIANATSTVALFPGSGGALWGYRREIGESRAYLVRLGLASLLGGGVGAGLLLLTPSQTFARLVPFLILFATALFMTGETLNRRLGLHTVETSPEDGSRASQPSTTWWIGASVVQFFSGMYGGYFGAGNGILMLATLGLIGIRDIHRANGIKNFLAVVLNSIAVVMFAFGGIVAWLPALLMAIGAIAGGYYGATVAKRLGRRFVRTAIICIGLTIGLVMLWRLHGGS